MAIFLIYKVTIGLAPVLSLVILTTLQVMFHWKLFTNKCFTLILQYYTSSFNWKHLIIIRLKYFRYKWVLSFHLDYLISDIKLAISNFIGIVSNQYQRLAVCRLYLIDCLIGNSKAIWTMWILEERWYLLLFCSRYRMYIKINNKWHFVKQL